MAVKLEKLSASKLYKRVAALTHERDELQRKLEISMEMADNSLLVLRAETARSNALAAENMQMRTAIEFATAPDMWIEQHDGMLDYRYSEWYVDVLNAAIVTPATDAVLADIRNEAGARAVELFAKTLGSPYSVKNEKCYEDGFTRAIEVVRDNHAPRFARQLRKGAGQ